MYLFFTLLMTSVTALFVVKISTKSNSFVVDKFIDKSPFFFTRMFWTYSPFCSRRRSSRRRGTYLKRASTCLVMINADIYSEIHKFPNVCSHIYGDSRNVTEKTFQNTAFNFNFRFKIKVKVFQGRERFNL